MLPKVFAIVALAMPLAASGAEHWYQGGTLHGATLKEWAGALTQNKMATAADMVVGAKIAKRPAEVMEQSVRLSTCVDEAARDKASQAQDVATVAAICMALAKS